MTESQNKPETPKEGDDQALPLTAEEFGEALDKLFKRAREAGVRPLQTLAATYAKAGLGILDSLLSALEESSKAKGSETKGGEAKGSEGKGGGNEKSP